jgi:hypothetical protein
MCHVTEYNQTEIAAGLHTNSIKFAFESQSERGWNNAKPKNVDDTVPVKPVVINAGTV